MILLCCHQCGEDFEAKRRDAMYCPKPRPCKNQAFSAARRLDGRLTEQRRKHHDKRMAWQRERYATKGRYPWRQICTACLVEVVAGTGARRRTCGDPLCISFTHTGAWPSTRVSWLPCPACGVLHVYRGGSPYCCPVRSARRTKIKPARRFRIYARDNWTCQLCHELVERNVDPTSDWAASLDHVIPRSRGGDDSDSNLRLAHRWCNSVRGNESYYTAADLAAPLGVSPLAA